VFSVVRRHLSVVSWGRLVGGSGLVGGLLGVDSGALVGDVSDVAVVSIGGVLHVLDSAVGEGDGVRSLNIAGTIGGLLTVEVGLGVVVSDGICEGVGGNLIGVLLGLVGGSWLVSRSWGISGGSVDGVSYNGGSVDGVGDNGGSVDGVVGNGVDGVVSDGVDGVVNNWGVDGMVDGGNGVVGNDGSLAYWDWPVGSNSGLDLSQTLGVVSLGYGGVCGSESLALTESSDLTVGGGD